MASVGIGTILTVASAGMSLLGGLQANRDAKAEAAEQERIAKAHAAEQERIARSNAAEQERVSMANAANIEAETMEQKRRADQVAEEQMAESRAKAQASGSAVDGSSMDIFMGAEEDKFQEDIDWLMKSGQNRATLERTAGKRAAELTRMQGLSGARQIQRQGFSNARQIRSEGKRDMWSGIGKGIGGFAGAWGDYATSTQTAGGNWWSGYAPGSTGEWENFDRVGFNRTGVGGISPVWKEW